MGALLYALFLLKTVLMPFVAAFVLAYLLNPVVNFFQKFMNRLLAMIVVYFAFTLAIVGLLVWAVPMAWQQLQTMWNYAPKVLTWYNDTVRVWLDKRFDYDFYQVNISVLSEQALSYIEQNYRGIDTQAVIQTALSKGAMLANKAGLLVLIPILTFYYLYNWQARLLALHTLVPTPYRKKVGQIFYDMDIALMSFVKGQMLVMLLLGLVYAFQLRLIGLELGITIGLVAGLASFVPYLGFGLGLVIAMIAGFFQFGADYIKLGMIGGAFFIGQMVEGYILQPFLLGDKIGLSPLWVIFSVLAGAALFGFVGMLVALPVSAIINVLFIHARESYAKSDFYKGHVQLRLFDDP